MTLMQSVLMAIAALLFALPPAEGREAADGASLHARPIALSPSPERRDSGKLVFLAGFALESGDKNFGGLSGLSVADNGEALLAISDRGDWVTARLHWENGLPTGLSGLAIAPMLGADGEPLGRGERDAESLLVETDRVLVGYEGAHRILAFSRRDGGDPKGAPGLPLALPSVVLDHPQNGGIEAFTRLRDGRLLILSEQGRAEGGGNKGWLVDEAGEAAPLALLWPGPYVPTDATTLEDGGILVLLRHYTPLAGVSAKLVRLSPDLLRSGAPIDVADAGEEWLHLAPPLAVDNMEGLAVSRDASGRRLVFLISDDNFSPLQRTLLLVFALP